jgi:hypothetical protein
MLSNYKDVFAMEGDNEMCNKHLELRKSFQLHPILLMWNLMSKETHLLANGYFIAIKV